MRRWVAWRWGAVQNLKAPSYYCGHASLEGGREIKEDSFLKVIALYMISGVLSDV